MVDENKTNNYNSNKNNNDESSMGGHYDDDEMAVQQKQKQIEEENEHTTVNATTTSASASTSSTITPQTLYWENESSLLRRYDNGGCAADTDVVDSIGISIDPNKNKKQLTPKNLLLFLTNSSELVDVTENNENYDDKYNTNIIVTAKELVKHMSMREKLKLLTGATFWMTADLATITSYQKLVDEITIDLETKKQQRQQRQTTTTAATAATVPTSATKTSKSPASTLNRMFTDLTSTPSKIRDKLFTKQASNVSSGSRHGQQHHQNQHDHDDDDEHEHDDENVRIHRQVVMCDGPHGLRKPIVETSLRHSYRATSFPATCTLACSWDPTVVERVGAAISTECRFRQVHLLLSPGINLKRHPCGGRNFEYYSEDPVLTGILASAMIRGIQSIPVQSQVPVPVHGHGQSSSEEVKMDDNEMKTSDNGDNNNNKKKNGCKQIQRVGACVKHFAVNNQETNRFIIDAVVDERTLRELYLRSFQIILNNGTTNLNTTKLHCHEKRYDNHPAAIMTSYNKLNGTYVSETPHLLQQLVRTEWHYDGIFISDWGATDNRIDSIYAGLDLEMPGSYNAHTDEILQYYLTEQKQQQQQLTATNVIATTTTSNCIEEPKMTSTSTVMTRVTSDTMTNCDGDDKTVSITTTPPPPTVPNFTQAVDECAIRIINFIQFYTTPVSINNSSTSSTPTANWKTSESISSSTSTNNHNSNGKVDMYDDDKHHHHHSWFHGSSSSDKHNAAHHHHHRHHHQEQQHFYHHRHQHQIHTGGFVDDDTTELSEDELLQKNHKIAHEVAVECCVLLKNDNQCLPLPVPTTTETTRVAVIGDFGRNHPRFQGMGSSQINPYKITSIYDALNELYNKTNHGTTHSPVTDNNIVFAPGYVLDDDHEEHIQQHLLDEALEVSRTADVVLLCIGLPEIMEMEGGDRTSIYMPAQHEALVQQIGQQRTNIVTGREQKIIVILSNGSSLAITWSHLVDAIIEGYLLGSAGGSAIVDLLYGIAVPSGKLAESFAPSLNVVQADRYFPGTRDRVEHREGLNVGYRQPTTLSTCTNAFVYPFGHGLSYTTFDYTNIRTNVVVDTQSDIIVTVIFDIKNSGNTYTGKEVIQCYVHDVNTSVYRPKLELKDFVKICLKPQEQRTVQITLTKDAFAYYDIGYNDWTVECGEFQICIGSSSTDIRLKATIHLNAGTVVASKEAIESYPPIDVIATSIEYHSKNVFPEIDDVSFANRFGKEKSKDVLQTIHEIQKRELSDHDLHYYGTVHRNTLIREIAHRKFVGYLFYQFASRICIADLDKNSSDYKRQKAMMLRNFQNIPLRALVLFGRGSIQYTLLDGLIHLLNSNIIDATKLFLLTFKNMIFKSHSE